jgi:ankyrin repeat protein
MLAAIKAGRMARAVKLLRSKAVDPRATNERGENPLQLFARRPECSPILADGLRDLGSWPVPAQVDEAFVQRDQSGAVPPEAALERGVDRVVAMHGLEAEVRERLGAGPPSLTPLDLWRRGRIPHNTFYWWAARRGNLAWLRAMEAEGPARIDPGEFAAAAQRTARERRLLMRSLRRRFPGMPLAERQRACARTGPQVSPHIFEGITNADEPLVRWLLLQEQGFGRGREMGSLLLPRAIERNWAAGEAMAIAAGADPNAMLQTEGRCALVSARSRDQAERLVRLGANVNAVLGSLGWRPLMVAARLGSNDQLRWLLQLGADPALGDGDGNYPITLLQSPPGAEMEGGEDGRGRIEESRSLLREYGAFDHLLLFDALEKGNHRALRHLLGEGADPNVRRKSGDTLLCTAVSRGDLDAVRLLLDSGARVDRGSGASNWLGEQTETDLPLVVAVRPWPAASADGLSQEDQGAFLKDRLAMIRLLLERGADPNALTDLRRRRTVTHECAPCSEAIVLLARAGANLAQRDAGGETLAMGLCRAGQLPALRACLGLAPDPNSVLQAHDRRGRSLLHWAAYGGSTETARWLVAQGVDVSARLEPPAGDGAVPEVSSLDDLIQPLRVGVTPLGFAAYRGDLDMVDCLLALGADTMLQDEDGCTAADLAEGEQHLSCAEAIRTRDGHSVTAWLDWLARSASEYSRTVGEEVRAKFAEPRSALGAPHLRYPRCDDLCSLTGYLVRRLRAEHGIEGNLPQTPLVRAAVEYAAADFDRGIEEWTPTGGSGRGFVASLNEGLAPGSSLDQGKLVRALEAGLRALAEAATKLRAGLAD